MEALKQMDNRERQKKLDEFIHNRQEAQEGSLVIDFDKAVAEQEAQPIQVRFQGKTYNLPAQAPAWLPLFIARNQRDGVIDDEANLKMIEELLGKEFAAKIVDDRNNFVSFELINDKILLPVMQHWGINADQLPEDETSGKKTPTRA